MKIFVLIHKIIQKFYYLLFFNFYAGAVVVGAV